MKVIKINDREKPNFMELLLIADEQIDMIEKYLYRGDMFALYDDDMKTICIVTQEQPGIYELKNIVTIPEYQRRGYGQKLIEYVVDYLKNSGSELYVGTGDCPTILRFYERCGFVRSHVVNNFFIDNYDHPMFEDGHQLIDMIYLKRNL
jgi:GNAT superfamily N-acetyltransferase